MHTFIQVYMHRHMCLACVYVWTQVSLSLCPLCSSILPSLHPFISPLVLRKGLSITLGCREQSHKQRRKLSCARTHTFRHIHSLIHTLTQFHTYACSHTQTLTITLIHFNVHTTICSHLSDTLTYTHFNIQSQSHALRHTQVLTPTQPYIQIHYYAFT